MIPFQRVTLAEKAEYEKILFSCPQRGCEYSFGNLHLWGHQYLAFLHGCVGFFSHYYGKSMYPFPIGSGDKKAVIEDYIEDARQRGIPCRMTGLLAQDVEDLKTWFPDRFCIQIIPDIFDYVYDINDLADLRGRKYQKKRNHVNKFRASHPDCQVVPLTEENLDGARKMVSDWYDTRILSNPTGDYLLETKAIGKAFRHFPSMDMEGCMLVEDGQVLAMTMASRLSGNTYDTHFEKAREDVDGAYAAVNCEFARYMRSLHPEVEFLNREDDMGLEGLRKAKQSYLPHHMVEKYWAYLAEDVYED